MKTYQGIRTAGVTLVTVTTPAGVKDLPMTATGRRHSPGGFEWGYEGSGPAALAHAIVADAIGPERADYLYQGFKRDHVAGFACDSWELSEATLQAWLAKYGEEIACPDRPATGPKA